MGDMARADDAGRDDAIAQLRQAIGAIEATSADLPRLSPEARKRRTVPRRRPKPKKNPDGTWPPITYPGMPEGDGWMQNLPARYTDGERGHDRRIMEELAAVGVPCYTLNHLADRVRTVPQGIPIFVDWLNHLEERVPGPETEHRDLLRLGLIRVLDDPAARGNRDAINAVVNQLRRRPAPSGRVLDEAEVTLARIATATDFPTVAAIDGAAIGLPELDIGTVPAWGGSARDWVGGPLGSGRQWMSWISMHDLVKAAQLCLDQPSLRGPIAMVACWPKFSPFRLTSERT